MNTNTTETPPVAAWAHLGDYGADESMLVGNREGLLVLRDAIDRAIQEGVSSISEAGVEFSGIRRVDEPFEAQQETIGSKWANFGCLAVIGACFLIFVFGVVELLRQVF